MAMVGSVNRMRALVEKCLDVYKRQGSGKSTLLHLIGGVDRPTSGHVLLNGADVYARSDEELAVFRRREVTLKDGTKVHVRTVWEHYIDFLADYTPCLLYTSCPFGRPLSV